MHWTEYFCEFFGTAVLLFAGLTGIYLMGLVNLPEFFKYLIIGIFFALGLVAVVYSPLGKRSGGHINPAVTTAFWLNGLISGVDTLGYIAAQFAGAALGAWLAFSVFNWQNLSAALALPAVTTSILLAFFIEFMLVFAMITAIFSFISSGKAGRFTGLVLGVYIVTATTLFAAISGAGLNPARNLGPALLLGRLEFLWIYFAASALAAFAAYGFFRGATGGRQPACSKLCYQTDGPCLFKCHCDFKP